MCLGRATPLCREKRFLWAVRADDKLSEPYAPPQNPNERILELPIKRLLFHLVLGWIGLLTVDWSVSRMVCWLLLSTLLFALVEPIFLVLQCVVAFYY